MSDRGTDARNDVKFTQVDAEWLTFHSRRRGRVRTGNQIH